MSFDSLGLGEPLLRALTSAGYEQPTSVQAEAIPAALAGADLRVCSATGSGKTAAFILPALMRVLAARQDPTQKPRKGEVRGPRILVLVPTRELAIQVAKAASDYGRYVPWLTVASVVGGVPYAAQLKALRSPLDILIATPGRLMDHMGSGKAVLANVQMLVLDEADRMLDMGFIEDIEHIAQALPAKRQTLMASATFDGAVGQLAQRLQPGEVTQVAISAPSEGHAHITQQLLWADDLTHKHDLLDRLLTQRELNQAVVFTSTQIDADRLADRLMQQGHAAAALHGGMPQGRRNRVLGALRSRQLRILVATDVAARGIDVPTITHVINYGLPLKAEDYVHRIGRTGRAGREGLAVTLAERRDVAMIRRIQHYTTQAIPVTTLDGLEPRRPAPQVFEPRAGGAPKRSFGGHGGPRGHAGGWTQRHGYAPRQDSGRDHPARGPRSDRAPFDARFDPRFDQRREGPGDLRGHAHGDARGDARNDWRAERGHGPHSESGRWDERHTGPRGDHAPRHFAPHPHHPRAGSAHKPHQTHQHAPHGPHHGGGPRPAHWSERGAGARDERFAHAGPGGTPTGAPRGPRAQPGAPSRGDNKPRWASNGVSAGKRPRNAT